jgi:hypothetical protein
VVLPGGPPLELLRGVGQLCIGADDNYDPTRLIDLLIAGLRG